MIENQQRKKDNSAFPNKRNYEGYLHIRTKSHPEWRRKYFVLNNNFLLCGDAPHARELNACITLNGSNIAKTTQSTDMNFEIISDGKRFVFRASSPNMCDLWAKQIETASTLKIKDVYRFGRLLAECGNEHTRVRFAVHKVTAQECAIKTVDMREQKSDRFELLNEIQILKRLNHPSIVSLLDLFETKHRMHLVMEFCKGGELFEQIGGLADSEHYSEIECCEIMKQLAEGVQYMHDMGVVHRDLKLENILCVHENSIKRVKIADFGISTAGDTLPKSHERKGTLTYMAPELVAYRGYDFRVDHWSLGVILHVLVCGYLPFNDDTVFETEQSIMCDECDFDDDDWTHVSKSTQNLVRRLLCKDAQNRANCDDILQHKWIVDVDIASKAMQERGFFRARQMIRETVANRRLSRSIVGGNAVSVIQGGNSDKNSSSNNSNNNSNSSSNSNSNSNSSRNRKSVKRRSLGTMAIAKGRTRNSSDLVSNLRGEKHLRKIQAFEGRLGSKSDASLMSLSIYPTTKRDSVFAIALALADIPESLTQNARQTGQTEETGETKEQTPPSPSSASSSLL